MFKITTLLLCVLKISCVFSQGYFVKFNNDTVFCSDIDFSTRANGSVSELIYTDMKGNKRELKKKKNIPEIFTIYAHGTVYDRMPLKTKKPYGYHRFGKRVVYGKLHVSKYDNRQTKQVYERPSVYNPNGGFKNTTTGTYLFQINLPGLGMVKINNRNIKKIIKPYLINCAAFAKEYKDDLSPREEDFIKAIRLYNDLCDQ